MSASKDRLRTQLELAIAASALRAHLEGTLPRWVGEWCDTWDRDDRSEALAVFEQAISDVPVGQASPKMLVKRLSELGIQI